MRPASVYVGGLSDDIQEDDLEREFSKFGNITKVWVARNPPGFAFIEFDDNEDASEAIKKMNGATINGSEIRVDMSRGRGGRRGGGGRGSGGGGGGFRGGRDGYDSGFRSGGSGYRGSRGGGGYRYGGDRSNSYDRPSYDGGGGYASSGY